jgi:hypothetical protein
MATKTIQKNFHGALKPGETLQKMIASYSDQPFARDYIRLLLKIEKETGLEVIELRDALFDSIKHGSFIGLPQHWREVEKVLKLGIDPNRVKTNNSFLQELLSRNLAGHLSLDNAIKLANIAKLVLFYGADPLLNVSFSNTKNASYCNWLFSKDLKNMTPTTILNPHLSLVITLKSLCLVFYSFCKRDGLFGLLAFEQLQAIIEYMGGQKVTHFKSLEFLKKLQTPF